MRNSRSALRSSSPSALTNSVVPSVVAPKYGVEPRASTLGLLEPREVDPDRRQPGGDRLAVGRRDGAPNNTIAALPATQPDEHADERVEADRRAEEPGERGEDHHGPPGAADVARHPG